MCIIHKPTQSGLLFRGTKESQEMWEDLGTQALKELLDLLVRGDHLVHLALM